MKTTFITTVAHNIGDDFVREGILYLLKESGISEENLLIHKHSPVTCVYGFENYRSGISSKILDPICRIMEMRNRIDDAELLVQSGAPIYWCHSKKENCPDSHCSNNEWYHPLVRKRFIPKRKGRKFLNLAGGSCQTYNSDGTEFVQCQSCLNYIQEFFDSCELTVLRDSLAKKILQLAGRDAEVLPCTSIFARDRLKIVPQKGEFVVLNFMDYGGHYTFGQKIDRDLWRNEFITLARTISKSDKTVVACHTEAEERLARLLVPEIDRFLIPNDYSSFMKFYSRAKWGVMNRVHGAFMLASLGKPAAVIGNDSRAKMIENLKLPSYYVQDVSKIGVEAIIESARSKHKHYIDEIEEIRTNTRNAYISLIRSVL